MAAWSEYLFVAIGSALGGMSRHWVALMIAKRFGEHPTLGTITANVTGSFLIGVLAAFALPDARFELSRPARLFLMTGVMGGYTTFSAFSMQTLLLARQGDWMNAGLNVAGSITFCLGAVTLGFLLGAVFNR